MYGYQQSLLWWNGGKNAEEKGRKAGGGGGGGGENRELVRYGRIGSGNSCRSVSISALYYISSQSYYLGSLGKVGSSSV